MKNELPQLAQDQRQHLVQVKMLRGFVSHLGRRVTSNGEPIRRNLKIRKGGKTQQIASVLAVKLRPQGAVRKYPFMEGRLVQGCLRARGAQGKIRVYFVSLPMFSIRPICVPAGQSKTLRVIYMDDDG